ncbi:MAG TPA: hypothetical protein VLC94_10545 [Candidatus Acidoferrum sp.]|nr:hypothetical protein [Candidatus Acidoferrum sp.]
MKVGDAEDVGGVDVGAGIPGLNFFEIRDGVIGLAGEIERQASELKGFGVVGIFDGGLFEPSDGVEVIGFAVVSDAVFVGKIFRRRSGFGKIAEDGEGLIELALFGETVDRSEIGNRRGGGSWRSLREACGCE